MRITIVGSSHGVPEAHRKCSCIMIEVGRNIYFVDMGTSGMDALRNRNLPVDSVKGIFITHMHGDHIHGLVPFVDLITWYFKSCDPDIYMPDPEAGKILCSWLQASEVGPLRDIRFHGIEPGVLFDDGVIKLTAVGTQHCQKSFAFFLEAEGKRVLFTGDLRNPGIDFPAEAADKPLDLVVCESAHFEATDYLPVFEKCDIRQVCVTHYFEPFIPGVVKLCETMKAKGVPAFRAMDDAEIVL